MAAKVRVVRCPKCANFLPELGDYSLYQCGGCGAVLQAGSKRNDGESSVVEGLSSQSKQTPKELGSEKLLEPLKADEAKEEMVGNEIDEGTVNYKIVGGGKGSDKDSGNSDDVVRSRATAEGNATSSREVDDSDRSRVASLDDRAELLRKLDELKEQLSKTGLVAENPSRDARWSSVQDHFRHRGSYYHDRRPDPFPWHSKTMYGYHYSYDSSTHTPFCTCNHCYNSVHQPFFVTGRDIEAHSRWGGGSSDVNRFLQYNPRKIALLSRGKTCQPVAGGAPYITCPKCFEILKVPQRLTHDKKRRVKCGGCSHILYFSVEGNRLLMDSGEEDVLYGEPRANLTFSSNDFDRSGYEFLAIDSDLPKASEMRSMSSSSSSFRETDKVRGSNVGPSLPGSPPASCNNSGSSVSRLGKGNCSCRSDHEAAKVGARKFQTPPDEVSTATETDVSYTEYSSTDARNSKGESFFASLIKNFNLVATSSDQPVVRVNGHIISERQVKKAEKIAGPVHPGSYWYDSFAGFWGVSGGHCLGIIPAKIKEFNYPMEEKCSGGDTGVFVNGRELHKKDLDLLASRGLPSETDRSYVVHVSGKVVDEDTGEELESLGKLAPTIEKRKHGFGMKPPKIQPRS